MEELKIDAKSEELLAPLDIELEQIGTNWRLTQVDKRLCDCVSKINASKAPGRLTLDDIVSDSCLILQPINTNVDNQREACTVDIKLIAGQRICRIGLVSEGSVLEFFKDSGEYAGTSIAELLEAYDDATVYLSEFTFDRPTNQASIKFTRIDNTRTNVYLYGIKLVIDDAKPSRNDRSMFEEILKSSLGSNRPNKMGLPDFTKTLDYGMFETLLAPRLEKLQAKSKIAEATETEKEENSVVQKDIKKSNIELYIDDKLRNMEERLLRKIDEVEVKTIEKLDRILGLLQSQSNAN